MKIGGNFSLLPPCFYTLPNLEEFSIVAESYCLPDEIGNFSSTLKKLSLEKSGCIFFSQLVSLSNLEVLQLKSPYGFTVNDAVLNLGKLREMYLESDYPIQISNNISQLNSLETLFYYSWNFPIDENIYGIPNLKTLVIGTSNNVSENVGSLQKLEHLQVQFKGNFNVLPKSIGNITTLKKVDFTDFYAGTSPDLLLPGEYFTNWTNLEQFWAGVKVSGNITNRFLNNPNLKSLVFNGRESRNFVGKLNLCQNPNVDYIRLHFSGVEEVDLRNISSIANGTNGIISFRGNPISKFIVDDVTQFNNLVSQGKITVPANVGNYTVVASEEPCTRILAQQEVRLEKSVIFPNPVNNLLTIKTDNKVENVEIISTTGQKYRVNCFNNKVDLSDLPTGLYMIQWSEKGLYKIEKIIKQ